MQKYQEALNNVKTAPSFMGGNIKYSTNLNSATPFLEDINVLQELVDQTKTPTLEEVKKEWEEDGFTFYKGKDHIHFRIYDELGSIDDEYIFHPTKKYYVANDVLVTFKRFQLISKTIKVLEEMKDE